MNQEAFTALIKPFQDKVFRLAKRMLTSHEEAEDATQEVLLKLWNQKKIISTYNNVEAFTMTMTKNFCYDRLKSKQAQNLKISHSNYNDENAKLQNHLEYKDSLKWVSKIIETLPEQQKLVVQLRDIEQYNFTEIAKILEMNDTAVRVNLSRARKTIREQLLKAHEYGTQSQ